MALIQTGGNSGTQADQMWLDLATGKMYKNNEVTFKNGEWAPLAAGDPDPNAPTTYWSRDAAGNPQLINYADLGIAPVKGTQTQVFGEGGDRTFDIWTPPPGAPEPYGDTLPWEKSSLLGGFVDSVKGTVKD